MRQNILTKQTESDKVIESDIMHQNVLTMQTEYDKVIESDIMHQIILTKQTECNKVIESDIMHQNKYAQPDWNLPCVLFTNFTKLSFLHCDIYRSGNT